MSTSSPDGIRNPEATSSAPRNSSRRLGCLAKTMLWLFGILLLLLLAALFLLPRVLDPNQYRDSIAQAVETRTGRSLTIEGDIALRFFPWLKLDVGALQLGNPPGYGHDSFLEVGSVEASIRVWPLLSRRLEIGMIRLDGLQARLIRQPDGSANWDGLADDTSNPATPAAPKSEPPSQNGFQLGRVGGLRITDTRIRYEDQAEGTVIEAVLPLVSLGEIAPDKPIPLHVTLILSLDEGAPRTEAMLDAQIQVSENLSSLAIRDLELKMDDTTVRGWAEIGWGEISHIRSAFELDTLDLDRYLPPAAPEKPGDPGDPIPEEDQPLAFEAIHGLDLEASFRAGQLRVSGLMIRNLEAGIEIRDGIATLHPLTADLYEGHLRGRAQLDSSATPATFTLEQALSEVQLLPFMADLSGFTRLTGTANMNATLRTTASTTAELLSGLKGDLSFDVSNGVLKDINLWYEIQRAYALTRGRSSPKKTSQDTEFRKLGGTAVIGDGVLVNQDLTGGLEQLTLKGRGEIDLAASTLDYQLSVVIVREVIDEATGARSELAGAQVPLTLQGPLDAPSVRVDFAGFLRDQAARELQRRLGSEAAGNNASLDDIQEQLEDGLRSLRDRLRR